MTQRYKRLVIDTDIVSSAGDERAKDKRSARCRDFLIAVKSAGHRIVLTDAILEEWNRHRSAFARKWLISMFAHRKVDRLVVPADDKLRLMIVRATDSNAKQEAMLKDIHLIEAALNADKIVFSIDETAKGYFREATQSIIILRQIAWINPCLYESCFLWLQDGAESVEEHILAYFT